MYHTDSQNSVATPSSPAGSPTSQARLDAAIRAARRDVLSLQHADGYWCHELEADCTIPAEYILMLHFLGESEPALEAQMARYLRRRQRDDGGWPLYEGGDADISCSVKAYFALKLAGDTAEEPHMQRARATILTLGGAARANVFTRITLAMFGEVPWRGVPCVPIELMLLPTWFWFHVDKVSYWSRTVMTPLALLCSLKARAANPLGVRITELFVTPAHLERRYFAAPRSTLGRALLLLDRLGHVVEPRVFARLRRRALARAESWILERMNGSDGLGAIFPAMVNACEALAVLGYPPEHPSRHDARQALRDLVVVHGDEAYCQPCTSPVWDTALTCLALQEDLGDQPAPSIDKALDWLRERQLLQAAGDWCRSRPGLAGGGWAFQFRNDAYPDLDDTAVVALAMKQAGAGAGYAEALERAADWLVGMQSRSGGFAAFDADNDHSYLNEIPFADHGALLDPPTSDVSARVLTFLSRLGRAGDGPARERVLAFLRSEQTDDGAWFGRWGTNYLYGTWSVLMALEAAGVDPGASEVRRAVAWLKRCQRDDGSWGESNDSYIDPRLAGRSAEGNATQTAWALLALMAGGESDSGAVDRGVMVLLRMQRQGRWDTGGANAPGFPRVFYLKYHGYSLYFPYWALARYRNARAGLVR